MGRRRHFDLTRMSMRTGTRPRKRRRRLFVGAAVVALLVLVAVELKPGTGDGAQVTRVYDGDTIEALVSGRREKIRYIGIDTPEMTDTREPVLELAREARVANRRLVQGRVVRLERDVQTRDTYGRLLAYVWLGDTLVNELLVREGFAVARSFPPNVRHQDRLRAAQEEARSAARGVWDGRLGEGPLRQRGDQASRSSAGARPGDGLRLDAFDASRHPGVVATVCGTVAGGRYLGGDGLTFLNLERRYPNQPFTIVIPIGTRRRLGGRPETELRGVDVCVAGMIELHRGTPQIMIHDPAQLER
ncbi:MAG: thermonuclease family protein [Gemmatimonadota bacterium]